MWKAFIMFFFWWLPQKIFWNSKTEKTLPQIEYLWKIFHCLKAFSRIRPSDNFLIIFFVWKPLENFSVDEISSKHLCLVKWPKKVFYSWNMFKILYKWVIFRKPCVNGRLPVVLCSCIYSLKKSSANGRILGALLWKVLENWKNNLVKHKWESSS